MRLLGFLKDSRRYRHWALNRMAKRVEKYINDDRSGHYYLCYHNRGFRNLIPDWKQFPEILKNMGSKHLHPFHIRWCIKFNCGDVWFKDNEERYAFLQECLKK